MPLGSRAFWELGASKVRSRVASETGAAEQGHVGSSKEIEDGTNGRK